MASYKEVIVVDPATGKTLRRLAGFPEQVTAVAYSPDGSLAGAGGTPGRGGEVRVWDADGRGAQAIRGHADTILAVAWRPGNGFWAGEDDCLGCVQLLHDAVRCVIEGGDRYTDLVAAGIAAAERYMPRCFGSDCWSAGG